MASMEVLWGDLLRHRADFDKFHLRQAFSEDPYRFNRYSIEIGGDLTLDFSRHRISEKTLFLLESMFEQAEVRTRFADMCAGKIINETEHRSVLHTALRGYGGDDLNVNGQAVAKDVALVKQRFLAFAAGVRDGFICGQTGKTFTDVVNVGIGGSDLGPRMVTQALKGWADGPQLHFISNVDGAHLGDCLENLNPETTLFLVASKTFTTQETMANAKAARGWIVSALGEEASGAHFAALSTNAEAVKAFGISTERMFEFWDWVGGRYSVWSAIGLPVAIAIGPERFEEFLSGGRAMDEHFASAPFRANMPMVMAALGLWYRNIWACGTQAVLPYDQRLGDFPAFLQQLDMESNGKMVRQNGKPISRPASPVIWGSAGTNGQHAFYQSLHQGADMVPCDFLIAAKPNDASEDQHEMLLANCLAQIEALAFGREEDSVRDQLAEEGLSQEEIDHLAPHRTFAGNRPTTLLLYEQLTPHMLGRLIALYEHKVFAQGVIWGVNSFDQWGVELGKVMANRLLGSIQSGEKGADDPAVFQRLMSYRAD
jgi:glucose-6-phosphate isomerase